MNFLFSIKTQFTRIYLEMHHCSYIFLKYLNLLIQLYGINIHAHKEIQFLGCFQYYIGSTLSKIKYISYSKL